MWLGRFDGTDELFEQLEVRCMNEEWRFSQFINDGDLAAFEFTIIPNNGMLVNSKAARSPSVI